MDIEILEGYNHEMGIEMLADGFVASAISHSARCSLVREKCKECSEST